MASEEYRKEFSVPSFCPLRLPLACDEHGRISGCSSLLWLALLVPCLFVAQVLVYMTAYWLFGLRPGLRRRERRRFLSHMSAHHDAPFLPFTSPRNSAWWYSSGSWATLGLSDSGLSALGVVTRESVTGHDLADVETTRPSGFGRE